MSQPPDTHPGSGTSPNRPRLDSPAMVLVQAKDLLLKDLLCELRAPSAVSAVLVFALASLTVIAFAVGPAQLGTVVSASLLWVELLFAGMAGLSHVFTREEETGTALLLRLNALPNAVYLSKLGYNLLLLFAVALIVGPLYASMLKVAPASPILFACSIAAGLPALAAASTVTAGLVARAGGKGALFGAISLPLLLPFLFIAIDCTRASIVVEPTSGEFVRDSIGLVAYAVMLITASLLVFPLVWDD